MPEDFKSYQCVLRHMASALSIQAEFVHENTHKLLAILQSSPPGKVAFSINEVLLEPVKSLWNTPASLPLTAKWADKRYFVRMQDFFFYSHPALTLLLHWQ